MEELKKKVEPGLGRKSLFCLAFLGDTVSNLWLINIFQALVNSVTGLDKAVFRRSTLLLIVALAVNVVFLVLDQYFFRSIINYGEMNLKKHTFRNYLLNAASSENSNGGKIVSRINSDVPIISAWISIGPVNSYMQIAYLILCLAMMLVYSAAITAVTCIVIGIVFLLSRQFAAREAVYTKQLQHSFEMISDKIYNSFLNMKTIRQLGKEDYFTKKVKKIFIQDTENQVRNLGKYTALNEAMLEFMTDVLPLSTFFLGVLLFSMGSLSLGTALAIMLVAQKLNQPVIVLAELIADKKNAEQVYERIRELYDENPDENRERKPVESWDTNRNEKRDTNRDEKRGTNLDENRDTNLDENRDTNLDENRDTNLDENRDTKPNKNPRNVDAFEEYQIRIKRFGYGQSNNSVLNDVHFNVKRGDLCVIKGESGKGKTTLLKLIAGFIKLDKDNGEIQYNHVDIQRLNPRNYHHHVLLVEQNAIIIEGSLEENILLGDSYPRDKMDEVIYISKLDDFYNRNGVDYRIKENGRNISGGEKQRINFARILIRNPEILILDEVTSNLDKEIRREMISRLMEYKKRNGTTIIAVTHNDDFDCFQPRVCTL